MTRTIACWTPLVHDPDHFQRSLASAWQCFAGFIRLHGAPTDLWERHDLEADGAQVVIRDMTEATWQAMLQSRKAENSGLAEALLSGRQPPTIADWASWGILDLDWVAPGATAPAQSFHPNWENDPRPADPSVWWETFGWMPYRWRRADDGTSDSASSLAEASSFEQEVMTVGVQCLFCGQGILAQGHDLCFIPVASRWGQHPHRQRKQGFWCHEACLRQAAHPRTLFEIFDP